HAIQAVQQQLLAQGVTTAVLGDNSGQLAQLGAGIASTLILKGYDRAHELEADKAGALYAYNAGYDPRELGNFLKVLRDTAGDTPAWLTLTSDHPRTDDRVQQLNDYIAQQKMQVDGKTVDPDDFQSHVTALVGTYTPPASGTASPTPAPSAS
ncbi:MAG TPA: M48 family metalloprotease, partial [Oscillatoriaceae cyanobacterium]